MLLALCYAAHVACQPREDAGGRTCDGTPNMQAREHCELICTVAASLDTQLGSHSAMELRSHTQPHIYHTTPHHITSHHTARAQPNAPPAFGCFEQSHPFVDAVVVRHGWRW